MRLFVAVYPSPEALDDLEHTVGALQMARLEGVNPRLTARPLWHVTLAFLGEVPEPKVPEAARALDRASESVPRPALRCAGGGRFGRGRFTLLWAGLAGDVEALTRVSRTVRRELRASRLRFDEKRFAPHLTIARPGDRVPVPMIAADLATLAAYRGPLWSPTAIELVASHLGPQPRHEVIHAAEIGGPAE
ncbi:MAG TPA: RNA 2',3'-cyclic phosphodiesterase [Micromonosporaceae bacterium]